MDDFPKTSLPPTAEEVVEEAPSSGSLPAIDVGKVAAVSIRDPSLQRSVHEALESSGVLVGGPDAVPAASVIFTDEGEDVREVLSRLRREARSDAAIFVVLAQRATEVVMSAHRAGAFACLREPLIRDEVLGLLATALDSRAAKGQVADLTKKLDLQSHLASIGRISAGLSHEMSNPLAIAKMNVALLRDEQGKTNEVRELLRSVVYAPLGQAEKRTQLAREYLESHQPSDADEALADTDASLLRMEALLQTLRELVGRGSTAKLERVDLQTVVQNVRKWADEAFAGVEVEEICEPMEAWADGPMLGQILLNLAVNAANAAKSLSAPRVRFHVYASGASGEHAVVSVRDNGPGIPDDMRDKVFEPFFTTRRGRGGTGLGLALCREYARKMGAGLTLWTAVGRGACFRVHLRKADG